MQDPIVQIGDPVLRTKALPVPLQEISSPHIQGIIQKMKDVLKQEKFGVAIAAPQIGESLRIFVVAGKAFETPDEETRVSQQPLPDRVFINPDLVRVSKTKKEMSEGCLSVRHKYGAVLRHQKASIHAWNEKGEEFLYHGAGLVGQIFQHEYDHLEGVLYVDKATVVADDKEWGEIVEQRVIEDHA